MTGSQQQLHLVTRPKSWTRNSKSLMLVQPDLSVTFDLAHFTQKSPLTHNRHVHNGHDV
jgi:hypothetical protein